MLVAVIVLGFFGCLASLIAIIPLVVISCDGDPEDLLMFFKPLIKMIDVWGDTK